MQGKKDRRIDTKGTNAHGKMKHARVPASTQDYVCLLALKPMLDDGRRRPPEDPPEENPPSIPSLLKSEAN